MKEADFQTRFGQRLRGGKAQFPELFHLYPLSTSGFAFELKLCLTGRALSTGAVADHQIAALESVTGQAHILADSDMSLNPRVSSAHAREDANMARVSSQNIPAKDAGLYLKLTDLSMGSKPFDCVFLADGVGRLILGWHDKGSRRVRAYSMTVGAWRGLCAEAQAAGRGSVTEAMVADAAEGMVEV